MKGIQGCFCKLGFLFSGDLVIRALLFGLFFRAPDFGSSRIETIYQGYIMKGGHSTRII